MNALRRASLLSALAAYQLARPRLNAYGATAAELEAAYPGDDLIPQGRRGATMCTSIAAPPTRVWPWLVQMGCDRAGWYSWDRLDNGGRPSAQRIHPEWQQVRVGDRMASVPDGSRWFHVAALEAERTLVLRASLSLPDARPFDPAGTLPRYFTDSTWGFHLRSEGMDGTRLVTTGWVRTRPGWISRPADWLMWDPMHWVMQIKQFNELRRRAEGAGPPSVVPRTSVAAGHR